MGQSFSGIFGVTNEESSLDGHLQLSSLGGFLSKYIFIMLDKDKKKSVSKQEYLTLVNHFREEKTSLEDLENCLKEHAIEGESSMDCIDEATFQKLIVQLAVDFDRNIEERMNYLMNLFDKDGDGFVSEADLCNVYDAIGIQVPMDPIKCLISKFDVDGDGKLSAEEFEQLGRSAMNKLFIRKEEPPISEEDILVNEAIERATIKTKTGINSFPEQFRGLGDSLNNFHPLNNNKDVVAAAVVLEGSGENPSAEGISARATLESQVSE